MFASTYRAVPSASHDSLYSIRGGLVPARCVTQASKRWNYHMYILYGPVTAACDHEVSCANT